MAKQVRNILNSKSIMSLSLALTIAGSTIAPTMSFANTNNNILAGQNRYETAVKVAKYGWETSKEVVLVNATAMSDALAATPLATQKDAPVLLTSKDGLGEDTKKALIDLKVQKVNIVGGENSVSKKVEDEIKAMGLDIERIQGQDRYETSLNIAKAMDKISNVKEVAVVGANKGLADAISIAPVAGDKNMPIILSTKDSLGDSEAWIKEEGINKSYVVGGDSNVGDAVLSKLPNAERISGIDRHETNAKVVDKFYTNTEVNEVYFAKSGMGAEDHLVDALAVGSLAAKKDAPVIILGQTLNKAQEEAVAKKEVTKMIQVGNGLSNTAVKSLKDTQIRETIVVKTVEELQAALRTSSYHDVIEFRPTSTITENIEIDSDKFVNVSFYGTFTGKVTVKSQGTTVVVDKDSTLSDVTIDAPGVEVENGGTIDKWEPADDTVIEGNEPSTGGGGTPPPTPQPDTTAPVITLTGEELVSVVKGDEYTEPGAKASDNKDGDVTESIKVTYSKDGQSIENIDTNERGEYKVHYNVSDEAGNNAIELVRTVIVYGKSEVANEDEFIQAMKNDEIDYISLTKEIDITLKQDSEMILSRNNVVIEGNGNTLKVPSMDKDNDSQAFAIAGDNNTLQNLIIQVIETTGGKQQANALTITGDNTIVKNVEVNNSTRNGITTYEGRNTLLEDVKVNNSKTSGININGAETTIKNVELTNNKSTGIEVAYGTNVTTDAILNVEGTISIQKSIIKIKAETKKGAVVNHTGQLVALPQILGITTYDIKG